MKEKKQTIKPGSFKFTRAELLLIFALALFQFAHIIDFMLLMPLGPMLMEDFGINNQEFSYLVSSYTFSAAIVALLSATFIDRFHRKKALMFVFGGFLVGTFLCAVSNQYHLLLASRIVTGAFGGITNALILSMVGDAFHYNKRGSAMGVIMAAFSAASVAGVPLSLLVANRWGWNTPFYLLSFIGVSFIIFAHYAIPTTKKVARAHPFKEILTEKNHFVAFAIMFFVMFAGFTMFPFISNFLVFNVGLTQAQIPLTYLSGGFFTLFTARIIGYLADRYGKKTVYYIIALISTIPIYLITQLTTPNLWIVLTVTTTMFIFMSGRVIPVMAIITSSAKPHLRGSFMTVNTSVQQLSAAIATMVGGIVIGNSSNGLIENYDKVALISVAAALTSLFFVYKVRIISDEGSGAPVQVK